MTPETCPPALSLSAWLDDELGPAESARVRSHLERCAACRDQIVGWVKAVDAIETVENGETRETAECPEVETLVAYADGELAGKRAADTEQHLMHCTHCTTVTQRLVHWRMAVEDEPRRTEVDAEKVSTHSLWQRWVERLPVLRRWRTPFTPTESSGDGPPSRRTAGSPHYLIPAMAACALLLLVGVSVIPPGQDSSGIGFRDAPSPQQVRVVTDGAIGRARPAEEQPLITTLARGTNARLLEKAESWTRVELSDGRRVWVRTTEIELIEP